MDKRRSPKGDLNREDRVTLESFERQVTESRRSPDYTTSRSRKRSRKADRGPNIILWGGITLVVLGYVSLLALHVLRSKPVQDAPAPVVTIEQPSEAAEPVVRVSAPVEADVSPTEPLSGQPSVTQLVKNLERAEQVALEGRKQLRNRRYAAAQVNLEEAVELAPNVFEYLFDLSRVLDEQKQYARARSVMLRAVSVKPDSIDIRLMLARTFSRLKEVDNALAMALWTLDAEPYSEEAHQIAAEVYTIRGRHDAAIYHWEKIAALNRGNNAARNNLGIALMNEGQTASAITAFETVIRQEPSNSQAYYYLSLCFIKKNEPELAVQVLADASTKLGVQFVRAWAKSSEFDAIRDNPEFQRYFSEDGQPGPAAESADAGGT